MTNYVELGYDYEITTKNENGTEVFFATFIDGEGHKQTVQIDKEVAEIINESQRKEATARRNNNRHCVCLDDYTYKLAYRDRYPSLSEGGLSQEEKVREVLSQMKPHQAELLKMYYYENMKRTDIAQKMGITPQAVKKRKDVAFAAFKKIFEKHFGHFQ